MINNYETKVFCDECLYKGLITDQDGKQWLQDEHGVNHPHCHTEKWIHLKREMAENKE